MAAAYAALSSILLTLDNILDDKNTALVSLNIPQLGSLHERVKSLRECLENMPNNTRDDEMETLQTKILELAIRVDDFIADTIHERNPTAWFPMVYTVAFLAAFPFLLYWLCIFFMSGYPLASLFLSCVCTIWIFSRPYIQPFVVNLAMVVGRKLTKDQVFNKMLEKITSLTEEVVKIGKYAVVGMENDFEEIMVKLRYGSPDLKIVSIVGMGGIGKTTLATQVYEDGCICEHFYICAWTTVSQEYRIRQVLLDLLTSAKLLPEEMQGESDDEELGGYLYRGLRGKRYLIVLDDVWDVNVWYVLRRFLPQGRDGSRVLLTTRLSDVGLSASSHVGRLHRMRLLNEHESRSLLNDRVFGREDCPHELKSIRDEILQMCGGLPLAIVLISGLLSKIESTIENWRNLVDERTIKDNGGDRCMEILDLSYNHLPRHLRPCFLYMGMFPEDYVVPITKLAQLWAAEGFLRQHGSKSPEELADEYLKELVERNLIQVNSWCSQGKMKTCMIHDVLRKLCLHKARKTKFLFVIKHPDGIQEAEIRSYLRLSIHKIHPDVLNAEELRNSRALSLLCMRTNLDSLEPQVPRCNYLHYIRLRVRVLDLLTICFSEFPLEIPHLVSLRYLALTFTGTLHPQISSLQNLETIVHKDNHSNGNSCLPVEIWMMPHLRHLHVPTTCLPSPPSEINNSTLQTLMEVINMSFGIQVINKIKELKKLSISYDTRLKSFGGWEVHQLENLVQLNQMEKLTMSVKHSGAPSGILYPTNLDFPKSLKKLSLSGCRLPWERLTIVGALPNLEVLKLRNNAGQGEEWEPIEEQYSNLKLLELMELDLIRWRADETNFPRLQCLIVKSCHELEEIPVGIGDIQTLERIELVGCHPPVVTSVKNIKLEQDELRDVGLEIKIS